MTAYMTRPLGQFATRSQVGALPLPRQNAFATSSKALNGIVGSRAKQQVLPTLLMHGASYVALTKIMPPSG
jgi:hypothetical protein